ncbi:caspase family protein [Psychromarinibacter sp. S121]|uniref:caspase family protein n=1 Tax=Psychromarinibacter sp. S121 TaxID=3415127 RepID=UPI003C7DFCE6
MADPALIFQDDTPDQPGVHAVVIGCGHYRHFPDGAGDLFDTGGEDLEQLSSPPHSARRIANWVLDTYHGDPEHPLRSLSLVIAEQPGPARFHHMLIPDRPVPDATMDGIRAALHGWRQRGDAHADNLMLFYFCGHGIEAGLQHTLLASDFGADPFNPFRHAIDFTQLHQGMAKCTARRQVYFLDACRVASENLFHGDDKGDPVFRNDGVLAQQSAPVFRSALAGKRAWGLTNRPSPFAEALPRAFRGGAWRKVGGRWVVCSSLLKLAIQHQIMRVMDEFRNFSSAIEQDNEVTMTLKVPGPGAKPMVPVDVGCMPGAANRVVRLLVQPMGTNGGQPMPLREPESEETYLLDLEAGVYSISARFDPPAAFHDTPLDDVIVHPPNGSERIEVT